MTMPNRTVPTNEHEVHERRREAKVEARTVKEAHEEANRAVIAGEGDVRHAENALRALKHERKSLPERGHEKVEALREATQERAYRALREGYLSRLKTDEPIPPMPTPDVVAAVLLADFPRFFEELHTAIDRESTDSGSAVFIPKNAKQLGGEIAEAEAALAAAEGKLGEAREKQQEARQKASLLGLSR